MNENLTQSTSSHGAVNEDPVTNINQTNFTEKNKRTFLVPFFLVLVFALAAITLAVYFFIQNNEMSKEIRAGSFEECSKLPGSVIQESYPPVCVTKHGINYTQQLSAEEEQNLDTPSEDIPADWVEYSNDGLGFSIMHPENWHQPAVSSPSGRTRITFQNGFIIESGQYFSPGGTDPLSFEEFVEENKPPAKTVINYTLTDITGRQFTYERSVDNIEYLIAIPQFDNSIFTLSYTTDKSNPGEISEYYKVVKSLRFNSEIGKPVDGPVVDYQAVCTNNSGVWVSEHNECEGLKKEICDEYFGVFSQCASPCRHNPDTEICITMCVEVCKF